MTKNYLLVGIAASCCAVPSLMAKSNTTERPNIIFILTDDQPYDLLGCTGNQIIKTPNIDRLAKEGVLFHNAHVSSAISKPSRTCLLTGQFERSHGVNFNSGTALSPEAWSQCYPVVLRDNGYYTGYVGKNHTPIGEKGYDTGLIEESFDYWYGGHSHLKFYPKKVHEIFKGAKSDTQIEIIEEGVMDFMNPNERNLVGALHFMDSRPDGKPFFLNICFNLPHGAGSGSMLLKDSDPELYKSAYRDIELPLPVNYIAKEDIITPKLPADILRVTDRQTGYDYVDTPETLRERMVREYQTVTGIDNLVGRLVAELKRQNLDKNTIIIFTSDHGLLKGEYGIGGKALCYELCTKVPLIVYDPRAPKSQRSRDNDELVLSIDISRSILNYANIEAPESYQGESFVSMLSGEREKLRDYLFTENLWSTPFGNPRIESVQTKEWKYIRYYKNDTQSATANIEAIKELNLHPSTLYAIGNSEVMRYRRYVNAPMNGEKPVYEELYNIKDDPREAVNVIGNNCNAEILIELRKECDKQVRIARGTGAPKVSIIGDGYKAAPTPKNKK